MPTSKELRKFQNSNSMSLLLTSLLIFSFKNTLAQETQIEINNHVWKPFIENVNKSSTPVFMALHSKDAVRSPRVAKTIWNRDNCNKRQSAGDLEDKKQNRKRTLELHLTESIVKGDLAFDVGVYRTSYLLLDGKTENYYGRFHVVMRKEKGVWKILIDTDSSEGGTIEEKDFLAANAMKRHF